jgi:chromosome partitioning protein
MLTLLVANTKGGCGKTTLATGLAGAFATAGLTTALADVDPQRSSLNWLKRRPATAPAITGLDWVKGRKAPDPDIQRLVIDAPAAMKIGDIEDLVRLADLVILPVLPSAFDEGATARFLTKLDELKPIRKNRKPVAVVGNRMRLRTNAAAELDRFLKEVGHQVVARLRDGAMYAELARGGMSLFDLRNARAADLRGDWAPLLTFILAESD